MAKRKGREALIKISDGAGGYDALAGILTKSLSINSERIDVTTPDAANPAGVMWRETLDGMKSLDISGSGRLVKDAAETKLIATALADDPVEDFEIVIPNVGTFTGTFSVNLEFGDDGAMTFDIDLQSTGAPTFVAEV